MFVKRGSPILHEHEGLMCSDISDPDGGRH